MTSHLRKDIHYWQSAGSWCSIIVRDTICLCDATIKVIPDQSLILPIIWYQGMEHKHIKYDWWYKHDMRIVLNHMLDNVLCLQASRSRQSVLVRGRVNIMVSLDRHSSTVSGATICPRAVPHLSQMTDQCWAVVSDVVTKINQRMEYLKKPVTNAGLMTCQRRRCWYVIKTAFARERISGNPGEIRCFFVLGRQIPMTDERSCFIRPSTEEIQPLQHF